MQNGSFMNLSRRTFITGVVGSVTLPGIVTAQDASTDLLQQIPGLQTAYARRYAPADDLDWGDFPIEPGEETPHYMLIMALTFDSEMMLRGVLSSMLNASIAGMLMDRADSDLTETSLPTLPNGNVLFFSEDESANHSYASLLVVPVGEIAYIINSDGDSDAIQETVNTIGEFLAESEPGDSPVTVENEGVASGGPFDAMYGTEDLELLNGLVPLYDYDLLVSESPILPADATPDASPES